MRAIHPGHKQNSLMRPDVTSRPQENLRNDTDNTTGNSLLTINERPRDGTYSPRSERLPVSRLSCKSVQHKSPLLFFELAAPSLSSKDVRRSGLEKLDENAVRWDATQKALLWRVAYLQDRSTT